MKTIEEILNSGLPAPAIIAALKEKTIIVPSWGGRFGLVNEYDPKRHPIMNKAVYPDVVEEDHHITPVTRVPQELQRLATKRMTELVTGIPVKRIYKPENDRQKEIAKFIEKIYERNRIDSVNIERYNMLFAGCEVMTLWYAVETEKHQQYGIESELKLRCRNFTPMNGDELFPLFDESGDMIAMSVGYKRKVAGKTVSFFDTYTAERHIKWSSENGWQAVEDEKITVGKIPAIYVWRPTPIWEDTSPLVYEIEWAMSRNGNYLRENSKPLFVVFADEPIQYGDEKSDDKNTGRKAVMQYPKGSNAAYVTWAQATESLKFHVTELRQSFFTQLQLPDWSYESMKGVAMSGESRKQLFIDCQLKVKDESGRLLEGLDREVNIIKAFAKIILPKQFHADIDALPVENEITAFMLGDDKTTIENLYLANGNKPLMSQRESIETLGWSTDVEKTMQEIAEEGKADLFEPTE